MAKRAVVVTFLSESAGLRHFAGRMTTVCAPPAARLHDARGHCLSRTRCRAGVTGQGLSNPEREPVRPLLAFTGGGIYFFWQVGVVLALREQLPSLKACDMVRAAPWALSCISCSHNTPPRAAQVQAP